MKSLPQKWAHISHFPPALKARMKNHFNRRFYTPPEHDSWEGYALNPNLDLAQISADFKAGKVVVIDGLLTPACLKAMKRIGSEGQVWHETKLRDYVGTGPFGPAPLAKLAEELELGLPGVFGEHTLHMHWGFKHDSQRGPRGIQVHADAAAINLNFWVTEDEANQAPDSATHGGGLTIFAKRLGRGTHDKFENYNHPNVSTETLGIRDKDVLMSVPYRENRAVMFHSSYFHQTQPHQFKPGYTNRRINFTLLFGFLESIRCSGCEQMQGDFCTSSISTSHDGVHWRKREAAGQQKDKHRGVGEL